MITGLAALAGPLAGAALADSTASFTTPGDYEFTVPDNVTSIVATAIGGAGGSCGGASGGEAASVGGTFAVTPGQQLSVIVAGPGQSCVSGGAGGIGGGGAGGGSGGGGASVLASSPFDPAPSALLVAAGGGGSGWFTPGGNAGAAGGDDLFGTGGGGAGTATAGGAGGSDGFEEFPGSPGGSLRGGAGGTSGGGGGGAGLFGGGGGTGGLTPPVAGGGGGASFVAADATNTSGPTLSTATPHVMITYPTATADLSSSTVALGSEPQGSVGAEQNVTVTNNGDASLLVSGVQVGGTEPGDYLISDRCQLPVAPGNSCKVGLRFGPRQQGPSSATLTLLTDARSAPAPIALSGTGTSPIAVTGTGTGPQAPAAPQSPTGPQGSAGSQSSTSRSATGAAGQVVCRDIATTRALCTLEFAPGTFAVQGSASIHANFVIKRSGRRVRSGRLTARTGRITRQSIGSLAHGRYMLLISTGQARTPKLLLTLPFKVH